MAEMSADETDMQRDHHRQLLAHLNIVRDRDDKVSYDDAMWLMMRAAERAFDRATPDIIPMSADDEAAVEQLGRDYRGMMHSISD
jgi:hypothetical protein